MRKSMLPDAPENMFQRAKKKIAAARSSGKEIIDLTVGEPGGPALRPARLAASAAILSEDRAMHRYQDNECHPMPDWAQRFVQCHVPVSLASYGKELAYLPAPGTKPMIHLFIQAMGAWSRERHSTVWTMTNPGYPTPEVQAKLAKHILHRHLPLNPSKGFLFSPEDILERAALKAGGCSQGTLIMYNLPHNPTGVVASREWWENQCRFCAERNIRMVNDNAYGILSFFPKYSTLTEVAVNFPDLSWCEIFSGSKGGNNTGWRVAAMVGSPDFIGDIARMKGEDDSGFVAAMALGLLELYENHKHLLAEVMMEYRHRLFTLMDILESRGMKLAVRPDAGFFVLCNSPSFAFGKPMSGSEEFNTLMIEETGVSGIPFGSSWVRYAVCATDIDEYAEKIEAGFEKAAVSYESEPVAA